MVHTYRRQDLHEQTGESVRTEGRQSVTAVGFGEASDKTAPSHPSSFSGG